MSRPAAFADTDFHHAPGDAPAWQESVLLFLMDRASGLTLYMRIGTQPVRNVCQEWVYIQTPDGIRFRRLRFDLPVTERTRADDGFGAGGLVWTYRADGTIALTGRYADAAFDLVYRDFYPSMPCWRWIGREQADIGAAAHYESSGRVTGRVTVAGRTWDIVDGLGHRDHSWGTRDGDNLRACRWLVGTTGPELSHSLFSFLDAHGNFALGGWVMRDGVLAHARALDIVADTNIDGLTVRGGKAVIGLDDGSEVVVAVTAVSSFITGHDSDHGGPASYVCAETVSRTRIGDRDGICCFTVGNNASGPGRPAAAVWGDVSTLVDGLSGAGA